VLPESRLAQEGGPTGADVEEGVQGGPVRNVSRDLQCNQCRGRSQLRALRHGSLRPGCLAVAIVLAKEIFWRSLPCNKLRYPCPPGPNRFAGFGSGISPFGGAAQPQQVRLFWHLSLPPHTAFHPDVPPLPTPSRAPSAPSASPPPPSAAQAPALATPKPPPSATSSRPLLPPAPRLRPLAEAVASSAPLPSSSNSSSPAFGGPAFGGQSGSFGASSPTGGIWLPERWRWPRRPVCW
jgi:hypothetical protein